MKSIGLGLAILLSTAPVLAQPRVANTFSDRLAKLDDLRRRSVLRRAVLDSGQFCDRVGVHGRLGLWRNLVMWNARCGRGGDYGVFIGNEGSVQVRPCADLAKLKLPACRLPPRAAAAAAPPRRR